jgi:hypothetical protein
VIVVVMTILAFRFGAPAFTDILRVAEAGDDEGVARLIDSGPYRRIALVDGALFGIAIFLMVVKPLA